MPNSTLNTLSFFVDRAGQIHSLPAVAVEVLALTDHPRVDCRKIERCIEKDPALVGKILRVVNSSLFGLGTEVRDLNQAIALLGIQSLKLLVLGFSLSKVVFEGRTGTAMQHAWKHTLTRALAARDLCENVWHVSGNEAFIAGLLAELGKFVLLDELGDSYASLLSASIDDHDNLSALEQAALGFDHIELSAELLAHWGLPASLVGAVRMISRRDELAALDRPELLLPAAVRFAGLVADLVVDERHDSLLELLREPLDSCSPSNPLEQLRLTNEQLEHLVVRVQERIGALAETLSCELPPGQDYQDLLIAAHRRLAQLSADAACVIARQLPIAEKRGAEVAGVSTALARYVNRFADHPVKHTDPPKVSSRSVTPIEELPQDARLLERLTTVVGLCRQARCPLSLVLFEVDRFRSLVLSLGPMEARNLARRVQEEASGIDHPGAVCIALSDCRFALVIADCERRTALGISQQMARTAQTLAGTELAASTAPTLSIGVATVSLPSKNFPPGDLLRAATRCLDAAKLSGGKSIKSIDVY